jgi:hypothetical protein
MDPEITLDQIDVDGTIHESAEAAVSSLEDGAPDSTS